MAQGQNHCRQPMVEVSDDAKTIYSTMVKERDRSGLLNMNGCLKISAQAVKLKGGLKRLDEVLAELQRAELVFPRIETTGWVVKHPVARI